MSGRSLLTQEIITNLPANLTRSPLRGLSMQQVLDNVLSDGGRIGACVQEVKEQMVLKTHMGLKAIQSMVQDVIQYNRQMQMSVEAAQAKDELFAHLMEQLSKQASYVR
jgi:hypothetical protein